MELYVKSPGSGAPALLLTAALFVPAADGSGASGPMDPEKVLLHGTQNRVWLVVKPQRLLPPPRRQTCVTSPGTQARVTVRLPTKP